MSSLPSFPQQGKLNKLKVNNFPWTQQRTEVAEQITAPKSGQVNTENCSWDSASLEQKPLEPQTDGG